MDLEHTYFVVEIIASVAVLISLIFVGMQIKQSNKIAQEQTRQRMMELGNQQLLAGVTNPELMHIWTNEELSAEDRYKISSWLTAAMRAREYEWLAHRNGMIDDETFGAYTKVIPIVLNSDRARRWWLERRELGEFHPEFSAYIDASLESAQLSNSPLGAGNKL